MGLAAIAGDLREDLWFLADFDRPTQLAGSTFGQSLEADGYCEGKFGKGYHFHRPAVNVLPPMREFLSEKWMTRTATGFAAKPVAVKMRRSNGAQYTAVTCSFYVKGPKDATLTVCAEMAPLTTNQLADAIRSHKGLTAANLYRETPVTNVVKLTGAWQRVHVAPRNDWRLAQTREVTLAAEASAPIEVERFQYEQSATYPYFFNDTPTVWTDGGTKRLAGGYETSDRTRTASFPVTEGAYAFWAKSDPESVTMKSGLVAWIYTKPWSENWSAGSGFLQSFRGCGASGKGGGRSADWHHYAGTWTKDRLAVYVDGRLVGERTKDVKLDAMAVDGKEMTFRAGCSGSSASSDAVLDEFAIFSRALTADEIAALAAADGGLLAADDAFLMGAVELPYYWRNDPNAALSFTLSAPRPGDYRVAATQDGETLATRTVTLGTDATAVRLPFDPSVRRPGRYDVRVTVADASCRAVFSRVVPVEIRGRKDRGEFLMMSWGGPGCAKFLRETVGLNGVNIWVGKSMLQSVRAAAEHDLFVNFRYENSGAPETLTGDLVTIAAKADASLAPYAGYHLWKSTLVNSEVWGFGQAKKVWKDPDWVARATGALGHAPSYALSDNAPTEMDYKKAGVKPYIGIVPDDEPTFATLHWMDGAGSPLFADHLTLGSVIRRHSPDNVVWSEPHAAGGFMDCVDMGSGWYYEYATADMLGRLRQGAGNACGKFFQPTLAMDYWPQVAAKVNGQTVDLGQTADELAVKSWIALAAAPAHSLSFFSADWSWGKGEKIGEAFRTNRTMKIERICEPGDPARYGAFVRRFLRPAAILLQDMPNVRPPLAVALSDAPKYLGRFWYGHHHHTTHVGQLLSMLPGAYDVVPDREMTAERLSQYPYVYVPLLRVVTAAQDAALRAAAENGTCIVLDTYCTNTYANAEKLKITYRYPFRDPDCKDPLFDFYTNRLDRFVSRLPAWSETDGSSSYTFCKETNGVAYVTVVNDARRSGGCIQTELHTNAWYRPLCAPQRVVTHFNRSGVVYEFNPADGNHRPSLRSSVVSFDYAPASARLFCIYPEPLAKPELTVACDGRRGTLRVRIPLESGTNAPGRTVVSVAITDPDGKTADESGLYRVEDGSAEIPLLFAADDPDGGLFSRWKATVTDLTTGLTATEKFRR